MNPKRQAMLERVLEIRNLINYQGITRAQVAKMMGISHQRVDQLYNYKKTETRSKTQNLIKKGVLTRPSTCHFCKAVAAIEAHHKDYTDAINVVWVCKPCHERIHHGDLYILQPSLVN